MVDGSCLSVEIDIEAGELDVFQQNCPIYCQKLFSPVAYGFACVIACLVVYLVACNYCLVGTGYLAIAYLLQGKTQKQKGLKLVESLFKYFHRFAT